MQPQLNLILTVPQGVITATSLGVPGFAWHRSPGSGKYFLGRALYIDLAIKDNKPDFQFLPEGDWRDAGADTAAALASAASGKRTKTALSNNAFSCTPIAAYRSMCVGKTSGSVLELENAGNVAHLQQATYREGMSPDEIAKAAGLPAQEHREPRLYMVFAPLEFLVLSNLTPEEYVWYATHRPGKLFRQVLFTELRADQAHLAAEAVFNQAREELVEKHHKKTKTIVTGECMNRVPFSAWVGFHREARGGVYAGDAKAVSLWQWPQQISRTWERASG